MTSDPEMVGEPQLDPYAEARMTVLEHLSELRSRVVKCLIAVAIGFGIAWIFVEPLFNILLMPLQAAAPELGAELVDMHHKDIAEPFFVLLKTAIFAGVFMSAPVILYQIWAFIAPGLYPEEQSMAIPFVILSTLFFVGGASFCFFMVMPLGFEFLLKFSLAVSTPELMMNEYLSLATKLLLGFGFVFEMPVFAMFLARIGVITHVHLLNGWRYAMVGAFIIAAMLTPPDVITQVMMAVPLVILYFVSVAVAYYFTKQREKKAAKAAKKAAAEEAAG